LYVFAEWGMRLFTDNAEVIARGAEMLRVMCFFYWAMAGFQAFSGIFRGAGDTMTVMAISVFGTIARVPLTYFMSAKPGIFRNFFVAMGICQVAMLVLAIIRYVQGGWKKKVVVTIDD
ncbi:MAG: hypothetical protein IKS29_07900, partial [Oscillospiraceae bacterium]|nr:hypothetical protein [Oscillospiraceae bacterium]